MREPLGYILFFLPAILGVFTLASAAAFVRGRTAAICCGVVGTLLLGFECLVFLLLPGVGGHSSRTVGWEYYRWPCFMFLGSTAVTWLYFEHALRRTRKQNDGPSDDDILWGVPVNDPESAIGAGWFVEVDGRCVAELTEPRVEADKPHWLSYVIVPQTDDVKMREQLFDLQFWHSGRASFRSRKFGVLAEGMLISGIPPCPNTHRIIARGFHIRIDPGPSLIERFAGVFRKGDHGA
jgi:hypothetical protein